MYFCANRSISRNPLESFSINKKAQNLIPFADRPEADPVTLGGSGLVDHAASDIRAGIAEVPATNHGLVALRID
jgi:hypothetical protein